MQRKVDDWIARYLQVTENSEPPRLYRLWTAITALSTVLERKCWLPWGDEDIYPNFYTVLVGPPGGRKGTAMLQAKTMIQEMNVHLASDCVSRAQLVKELAEAKGNFKDLTGEICEHRSLSVWSEEFSVFIGERNPDMIVTLTDLFGCPKKWKYSTKTQGKDLIINAYLTIFGAITPSILQSKLTQEAVGGGLISRLIFVVGYGPEKRIPQPWRTPEESVIYDSLFQDLLIINNLAGPFRFTERAMEEYSLWYMDTRNTGAIDADRFVGYNARRALHLRKLCIIISAAKSNKRIISLEHYQEALAIMKLTEREMPNAFFGLGRGFHAQTLAEMMLAFQKQGTMSWPEIVDRFKLDAYPQDLSAILTLLETSGRIKSEHSISGKIQYQILEEARPQVEERILDMTTFKYIKKEKDL
jgi:hypothetical protein